MTGMWTYGKPNGNRIKHEPDFETILEYMGGREEYFTVDCVPQDGRPTLRNWDDHIQGRKCLGLYTLRSDSTVDATCIDIDNHDGENPGWWDQAKAVHSKLESLGLLPALEISSSGNGAHIWIWLLKPCPGWKVRGFWKAVEGCFSFPFNEIFPKQDSLDGIKHGNFVRFPYWGESRFVDEFGDEDFFKREGNFEADLDRAAKELGVTLSLQEPISVENKELPPLVDSMLQHQNSILTRLWRGEDTGLRDRTNSARVQAMALQMIRSYVPPTAVVAALKYWCRENNYVKHIDKERWFERTVRKAYEQLHGTGKRTQSLKTSVDCALAYVEKLKQGNKLIPSGIPAIDESVEGVSNGEMAIIAARPGNGKSALALQWLSHAAKLGHNALLLSAEMSATEVGKRIIMHATDLPQDLWVEQGEQIAKALEQEEGRGQLWIEDVCQSIDDIDRLVDTHADLNNVSIIAIDYMQLISSSKDGRYEAVTEVSQRVKAAAKRNDLAILALCQMGRQSEHGETWDPQLSDLKESGQLEQDADMVMFAKWFKRAEDERNYCFKFAKRRNGDIKNVGTVCTFDSNRQLFRSPRDE